ncbi:MAG: N-acetylmuramic acid 6-phosphate etherase [Pararhizobium sp.]
MPLKRTEMMHDKAAGLDARDPSEVVAILAEAQAAAAGTVASAAAALAEAAALAADRLSRGGRIAYAGAGSSGLMALADALELPGTFGIPRNRVVVLFAGAPATLSDLAGGPEDDTALARRDVEAAALGADDCVIALSASGATPYTLAALEAARESGAATIAVANNPGAPLLIAANVAVLLPTPPEVVAGSTRMGAATAQKIALNIFSTLTAIHLGHIHDGLMVNVKADNAKLVDRAARIVAAVSGAPAERAAASLDRAEGSVKHAILIAAGAADRAAAERLLASGGMRLRPALKILGDGGVSGGHGI